MKYQQFLFETFFFVNNIIFSLHALLLIKHERIVIFCILSFESSNELKAKYS